MKISAENLRKASSLQSSIKYMEQKLHYVEQNTRGVLRIYIGGEYFDMSSHNRLMLIRMVKDEIRHKRQQIRDLGIHLED